MPIEDPSFDERWKNHILHVVHSTCERYWQQLSKLEQIKQVTEVEISNIIQGLKRRKAAGTDSITAEHLIEAG